MTCALRVQKSSYAMHIQKSSYIMHMNLMRLNSNVKAHSESSCAAKLETGEGTKAKAKKRIDVGKHMQCRVML